MQQPKVVIVLGTTAVGKTKLSVELGNALKQKENKTAELISADSVQIYKGLEICSDAITEGM